MSRNNWEGSPEQAEFIKAQHDAMLDALIAAGMWTGDPPYQGKTAADQVQMLAARAEAAESALRLATGSKGSTTVVMSLEVYEKMLDLRALVERYGADQWRRGSAGKDPQEFDEWQKEAQP